MTGAPEKIWATGNKTTGSWNHTPLSLRIAPVQTEYIRADISQARIATAREDALREAASLCEGAGAFADEMAEPILDLISLKAKP